MRIRRKDENDRGSLYQVSPFGNRRIEACLAAPRRLSQPRYVLHRLLKPRHPPYALKQDILHILHTARICSSYLMLFPAIWNCQWTCDCEYKKTASGRPQEYVRTIASRLLDG